MRYNPGDYIARITAQGFSVTEPKPENPHGTPYFWLKFVPTDMKLSDGSMAQLADDGPEASMRFYFSAKNSAVNSRINAEQLRAIGFTGSDLSQLDPETPGYQSFVGQTLILFQVAAPDSKYEDWQVTKGQSSNESHRAGLAARMQQRFGNEFKVALANIPVGKPQQQQAPLQPASNGAPASQGEDVPW